MEQTASSPLLSIRDLSVCFRLEEQEIQAVKNISFDVRKGETLALVGESGSGKSVSAYSVMRLLPHPKAYHPSGEILFQGVDTLKMSEREIRGIRGNKIGMVFQEPLSSLNPLHTVQKQISESMFIHQGLRERAANERVEHLLERVGIDRPRERMKSYPHELSGGQRQRVMIAMALANEPELLIADEPTTALDVTIQKQVMDLISKLQQEFSMGVLLITHDLGIVKHHSDRVAVMQDGQIVEQNSTENIFSHPSHDYTRELLKMDSSAIPVFDSTRNMPLMRVKDLHVGYTLKKGFFFQGDVKFDAVKGAELTLYVGMTLGIVGESGSGKSSLANALLRLIESEGEIWFEGGNLNAMNQKQIKPLRREIQVVFQDPFGSLSPRMSVGDIIAEGLEIHQVGTIEERESIVDSALQEVGMDVEIKHRYPHEFSGGQRQRIAIARALVLKPKLIILDEPTSALDRSVQFQVLNLLRDLQKKYALTYIFISHDLRVVRSICHEVMVMQNGEVVEHADTYSLFQNPQKTYTKMLLESALD